MANYSNKGPKMVPLDLYIQAGIDPKTGLPLKVSGSLPSELVNVFNELYHFVKKIFIK